MNKHNIKWRLIIVAAASASLLSSCNGNGTKTTTTTDSTTQKVATLPPGAIPNVLPFTIEFQQMQYTGAPLPALQSYQSAVTQNGYLLVLGGRRQGLHTFKSAPATNFIADSANNFIFVINPTNGQYWSFDVNKLDTNLSAPLQSTNQQSYHDQSTDLLYVVGGYGWMANKKNMTTFSSIISFNVDSMAAAIVAGSPASKIQSLFKQANDTRFAVTGGELYKMNNTFYLLFGQNFVGQYRAFGGSDFTQTYLENVFVFTLKPNSLNILSAGNISGQTMPDHPYHRRDGNTIEDVDPATGQMRISAFGGVFKPGIIAPYTYPVYITNPGTATPDTNGQQKFSQYGCPVITVFDSSASSNVYHTFFGGIGHYYYSQTDSQRAVFDTATAQSRNDGFPFVADVSTFAESASGKYSEYIQLNPIINNRLLGATVRFIVNPAIINNGMAYSNGVIKLKNMPAGSKVLVGYIYGGIEAQNPLPLIPNTGTFVSNSLFAVYVTNAPSAALPASMAHESKTQNANVHRK